MADCKGHPPGSIPAAIGNLPNSQADIWRHKCAACAYLLGREHGAQSEENLRNRVRSLTEQVRALEKELAALRASVA